MQGRWPYQPLGLLDRTHVRFYTPDSLRELLEATGWEIARDERVVLGVFGTELATFLDPVLIPDGLAAALGQDPSATTYQIVMEAVPGGSGTSGADDPLERTDPAAAAAEPAPNEPDPVVALLAENERLRSRVAELSEVIEEMHWATAQAPSSALRSAFARLPEPAQRRLRAVAGRLPR